MVLRNSQSRRCSTNGDDGGGDAIASVPTTAVSLFSSPVNWLNINAEFELRRSWDIYFESSESSRKANWIHENIIIYKSTWRRKTTVPVTEKSPKRTWQNHVRSSWFRTLSSTKNGLRSLRRSLVGYEGIHGRQPECGAIIQRTVSNQFNDFEKYVCRVHWILIMLTIKTRNNNNNNKQMKQTLKPHNTATHTTRV